MFVYCAWLYPSIAQFTLCLWKLSQSSFFVLQVCVKVHHPWYNQDNYSPFHNSYIPFKQDTWNVAIHRFIYWDKALLGSTTHCALQHLLAGLWHTPRPRGTPVVPCGSFVIYQNSQYYQCQGSYIKDLESNLSHCKQTNQSMKIHYGHLVEYHYFFHNILFFLSPSCFRCSRRMFSGKDCSTKRWRLSNLGALDPKIPKEASSNGSAKSYM